MELPLGVCHFRLDYILNIKKYDLFVFLLKIKRYSDIIKLLKKEMKIYALR